MNPLFEKLTVPKCSVCEAPAWFRVRLYEPDGSSEEVDLCDMDLKVVGGDYPDNIETVTDYTVELDEHGVDVGTL